MTSNPHRRRAAGTARALATVVLGALLAGAAAVHAAGSDSDGPSELDRARVALEAGRYDEAIAALEAIDADRPDDPDVLNLLGYAHRQAGRYDRALEHYHRALAIDPQHKGANEYLGELYLKTDDLAKAEERLAVLDDACFFPCSEYRDLEKAIQAYRKAKGL